MKQYPSITSEVSHGLPAYLFPKYDGSYIRAEWSRKHKKFVKFGSKTVLLGEDHPVLGKAISLIREKYEEPLTDIFLEERFQEAVCFFEFFGPRSFAGNHDPTDTHTVVLFDIIVFKKGLLKPSEFLKLLGDRVEVSPSIYYGNITEAVETAIRDGMFPGASSEGVVCKCTESLKNGYPRHAFKIKTSAWYQKLREFCQGNEELENQLK